MPAELFLLPSSAFFHSDHTHLSTQHLLLLLECLLGVWVFEKLPPNIKQALKCSLAREVNCRITALLSFLLLFDWNRGLLPISKDVFNPKAFWYLN